MDNVKTMDNVPVVSVIMPAFNTGETIKDAIASVQSQTFDAWELLIIDDCSTDDTAAIVLGINDPRIRYLKNDTNSGPAVSRNKGIEAARGTFLAFLDSDDLWAPEKLERQVNYMNEHQLNFSCTAYRQMDMEGHPSGPVIAPLKKATYWKCLFYGNSIGNSTAVYRVTNGKIYVPLIRKRNDFALWLKVLKVEPYCAGIPETLAYYRIREGSVSSNKKSLIKYQWYLYRKIEKLNVLICCLAFVTLAFRKLYQKIFVH